ncbi:MAG: hypothetical protein ACOYN6_11470 [Ignavibacteria bacterium]
MKITEYCYRIERDFIVFVPIVEIVTEPADMHALTAFRIVNTYRINLKLWKAFKECVFENSAVEKTEFGKTMLKEIVSLKEEIKMLKERSIS